MAKSIAVFLRCKMSPIGPEPTYRDVRNLVAVEAKADMKRTSPEDRL
jgi:hypothetical protein